MYITNTLCDELNKTLEYNFENETCRERLNKYLLLLLEVFFTYQKTLLLTGIKNSEFYLKLLFSLQEISLNYFSNEIINTSKSTQSKK